MGATNSKKETRRCFKVPLYETSNVRGKEPCNCAIGIIPALLFQKSVLLNLSCHHRLQRFQVFLLIVIPNSRFNRAHNLSVAPCFRAEININKGAGYQCLPKKRTEGAWLFSYGTGRSKNCNVLHNVYDVQLVHQRDCGDNRLYKVCRHNKGSLEYAPALQCRCQ